jgi:hypothetical protein
MGVDGGWLRDTVSLTADILGIAAFVLGLWTLQTARRIRREIARRRRLPVLHQSLSKAHREFRKAGRAGDRVKCRSLARQFLRATEEIAELGRDIDLDERDRAVLNDLFRGNMDQLDSADVVMHDVVELVGRLNDEE